MAIMNWQSFKLLSTFVSLTHYPDRNITSNYAKAYFIATGPCSLLEPLPKFRPTSINSPFGQIPKAFPLKSNDNWLLAHSHKYLLGSAILPSIADAATVAGDAR